MHLTVNGRTFTLRTCTDADYPFVYRLSKANMAGYFTKHLGGWHPEKFRKNFRKENITIVEHKKKRCGFIDLDTRDGHTYVSNIQLSTTARGKGLGTALMDVMEHQTKQKGLNTIRLRVFKENPAKKLYLRLGYKQAGDEGHSLILEKNV